MLFDVQLREREGWTVLAVIGELDLSAVPNVRQAARHAVPPTNTGDEGPRVVIDLSDTDFVDSAGLGIVLGIVRRVRQAGGRAAVVVGSSPVTRVFEVLKLDRAIPVLSEVDDVLARDRAGTLEPTAPALAGEVTGRDG